MEGVVTFSVDLWLQDLLLKVARDLAMDVAKERHPEVDFYLEQEVRTPTPSDLTFGFDVMKRDEDSVEIDYTYVGKVEIPMRDVLRELSKEGK